VVTFTSTGLAVTGTLSATGNLAANGSVTITGGTPGVIANAALMVGNRSAAGDLSLIGFGYTTGQTNATVALGYVATSAVASGKGYLGFYTRDVTTDTAPTERLRITSAGALAVASASPIYLDGVSGVGNTYIHENSADSLQLVAGGVATATATSTGLAVAGTLSASDITSVTDATDATSTTAASLKTAGGLAVAKKTYCGDNIVMASATTLKLGGYTVATLPAAGTAGRTAYVTDATGPTYLGALTGGGAVVCPVFDNGVAWVSA
jgi:hypothetical protein